VVVRHRVAGSPNACKGGSHARLRSRRCRTHEKRHSRTGRALMSDNATTLTPASRVLAIPGKASALARRQLGRPSGREGNAKRNPRWLVSTVGAVAHVPM
jgi:hypothetical protein